ncbi:hypothetical protein [Desulfosporosinus lacus]|uniref:Exonuclease SbcC n=1 Tax=Desulfosporosinus lacus DSM 15449 TaxID=1121420 RepID=A0A1M5YMF5_9FIRM|nr:hypothetical protein [Desulfosporosinus lacus]SHI12743.1 exonuclease SbcC [Desulfosporosinus lacus DSM 15449]
MRIERIRIKNYASLRDGDWIFPLGPVLITFQDLSHQKLFRDLLLTLFYDQKESQLLGQGPDSLIEVWMSGESARYNIRVEYLKQENELKRYSKVFDETGQTVCLPENMTLGEYLFNAQLQAFLQGGIVQWPERDHQDELISLISNLSQGGDERLSLRKMRASLAGAQKRVKEQRESMELIKAEYDDLRLEWETIHRQQEDERLLQIEIKNLQEKEAILIESIAATTKIQMRIELLRQNPDYRELRQLRDEIKQLEDRRQCLEAELKSISGESSTDQIIETFREECMKWACIQKEAESLADEVQLRSKLIDETQNLLLTSGYQRFKEDEDLQLKLVREERNVAQDKLNKLIPIKQELEKLEITALEENTLFADLAIMSDVTEADISRIAKKEKKLEQWRGSKVLGTLDRLLRKRLGMKRYDEILSSYLLNYYQRYLVSDYQEFTNKLKKFHNQQKRFQIVQRQMEKLQEKVDQESKLLKIVNSRNESLKQAFTAVNVADFSEWLLGWADYQQKKKQLSLELNQMNLAAEQKLILEKNLEEYSERMIENLKNWGIPTTDREEVLEAVFKVARQLQERDEVKLEIAFLSERFERRLGDRDMEKISDILEPLAELERENLLSNEERQMELTSWDKRRVEMRQEIEDLNQRLQGMRRKITSLSVLEKNIELRKSQWTGYEDLRHALDDAQTLLELSWQEWQTKYEKTLSEEKQWIFDHSFPSVPFKIEGESAAKRNYFSYRMAVAQLALTPNTEIPLLFSVEKITNEDPIFWEDVIRYLYNLSFSRQVVISTTDPNQVEKLSSKGWHPLCFGA